LLNFVKPYFINPSVVPRFFGCGATQTFILSRQEGRTRAPLDLLQKVSLYSLAIHGEGWADPHSLPVVFVGDVCNIDLSRPKKEIMKRVQK
jgi:hypothetical protein